MPYEDEYVDVIAKAQKGLGMDDETLAAKSDLEPAQLAQLKETPGDSAALSRLAGALGLNAVALERLGNTREPTETVTTIDGLEGVTTDYMAMEVNAYVVWDPASKEAAVFDSGADAGPLLKILEEKGLTLKLLLLTHTHGDHVADLERLQAKLQGFFGAPEAEPVPGAEPVRAGDSFQLGAVKIEARATRGHSPGGTTYVVTGLEKPVAVVGDALFACSMGGPSISYEMALEDNRANLFSLPDETVVCPGHGPLTSIGLERRHNPFFAQ